jgi:hypothetical protein
VIVDPEIARFSVDSPWVMYLTAPLSPFAARFSGRDEDVDAPPWTGVKRFLDQLGSRVGAWHTLGGDICPKK